MAGREQTCQALFTSWAKAENVFLRHSALLKLVGKQPAESTLPSNGVLPFLATMMMALDSSAPGQPAPAPPSTAHGVSQVAFGITFISTNIMGGGALWHSTTTEDLAMLKNDCGTLNMAEGESHAKMPVSPPRGSPQTLSSPSMSGSS